MIRANTHFFLFFSVFLLLGMTQCIEAVPIENTNEIKPMDTISEQDNTSWNTGTVDPDESRHNAANDNNNQSNNTDFTAQEEVCDGWDNDGNGQIDEGFNGQPCETNAGITGTQRCENGQLLCESCTPGTSREASCGCGMKRMDLCGSDGNWRVGACDGCEIPPAQCECTPGETNIIRCDSCESDNCGTTCMGALWECSRECKWEQISGCESRSAECNRDQILTKACDMCGSRRVSCDGCFWVSEICEHEGVCEPGEIKNIPCFEKACIEGYTSTIECNNQCQWDPPHTCVGCAVGTVEEFIEPCLEDKDCGFVTHQSACIPDSTTTVCDGSKTITTGIMETNQMGECELTCEPGQTQQDSCTMNDGRAGVSITNCEDNCEWGAGAPCGATAGSCVPNSSDIAELVCGVGSCAGTYQQISTCREDGTGYDISVSEDNCPECSENETKNLSCVTALGECGTQQTTCNPMNCQWNAPSNECLARSNSCVPGVVITDQISCGALSCSATFELTKTCMNNGCGWIETEDRSSCPECIPGDTRSESCITSDNRCGQQEKECSVSACEWTTWSACIPFPNSCSEGAFKDEECSGPCGSRGNQRYQCIECSWQLIQECDATPDCTPGEIDESSRQMCYEGAPNCGYRYLKCNEECTWEEQGCPATCG